MTLHADPDMRQTFELVQKHITEQNPHKITTGCKTTYRILDMVDRWQELFQSPSKVDDGVGETSDLDEGNLIEAEDVIVELI